MNQVGDDAPARADAISDNDDMHGPADIAQIEDRFRQIHLFPCRYQHGDIKKFPRRPRYGTFAIGNRGDAAPGTFQTLSHIVTTVGTDKENPTGPVQQAPY